MALEQLLTHYGALALFAGAALEGETVVILGGLLAHRGVIGWPAAIAAAALGSFLADQLLFWVGRRGLGRLRSAQRLRETVAFQRVSRWCAAYPVATVFAFRFLYGLRTIGPIAIGASGSIGPRLFFWANLAAAWVWGAVFVAVGYNFGRAIERLFGGIHALHHVLLLGVLGALVLVGLAVLLRRWLAARRVKDGPPQP
ncbi:MAG: Inner membrane protein YohD [Paracidovorax wautersii]|uniref:Inner membrane protein YohD n=1 Tax=Paracidovorax wautersii TaxID=1177982 RepID=A0A7V8FN37_9BURK|nr:MAG: Inner membrane protein YohD [Paracidovorax wautersii]